MACSSCDPSLAPAGPHHAGLFGIRFGLDQSALIVTKDGERIDDCYEVDVVAGKAWRFVMPARPCDCRPIEPGFAAYLDTGSFAVHQER